MLANCPYTIHRHVDIQRVLDVGAQKIGTGNQALRSAGCHREPACPSYLAHGIIGYKLRPYCLDVEADCVVCLVFRKIDSGQRTIVADECLETSAALLE